MRKLRTTELNRLSTEQFKNASKTPVVVVLDNVRSLLNVGSVFRTSDAFLFEKIYLCGVTPTPNNEMNKTALGAIDSMEWEYRENTFEVIQRLKNQNYTVIGIEQTSNSVMLNNFTFTDNKYALVLGNEVKGVNEEILKLCDNIIEIPQQGTKHSLNVSVCGGIISWELFKKLKK